MRTQSALVFQNTLPALPPEERNTPSLSKRVKRKYSGRITGSIFVPGQEGRYAEPPSDLPAALASALQTRGIDRPYSHQAEAWHAVQASEHLETVGRRPWPDKLLRQSISNTAIDKERWAKAPTYKARLAAFTALRLIL